ncbi:MBL fold metallo-hydrolase [Bacillus sp. 1P06AnD]|uniref:MBL fold metallo-hydrolase n=1 Tax=Bacillus sp. 1P06AnD TaxID=3132208 RepID=UPI0039A30CCE
MMILFTMALPIALLLGCGNGSAPEGKKDVEASSKQKTPVQDTPSGFIVTTIGTGSPPTEKTRTWAATLVQYKDKKFLVDCGGGCVHGLEEAGIKPYDIHNILFTHHHSDHDSDFLTMLFAGWATHKPRTELHVMGTPGTQKFYDTATEFYKEDIQYRINTGYATRDGILDQVSVSELKGGETFELDGVKISTVKVPHSIKAVAYKFEADGRSVVITGDTEYSEGLINFSKNANLVVIDGMLTPVKEGDPYHDVFERIKPQLESAHISLDEIGKTAAAGNYQQLLLTHLFNGEMDLKRTKKVVSEHGFKGKVMIAESLKSYEVR